MGRINFYHTVWRKHPTTGVVEPLENVNAEVHAVVNTIEQAEVEIVFANRTGTVPAELLTDEEGVVDFWLEPGDYNVHFEDTAVSPIRIGPFVVGASAVSGDLTGVQIDQLPIIVQQGIDRTGDLKCVAYTAPDTGWALCDGALKSRIDPLYAPLFAKIGTNFNLATGETATSAQFRMPDLRGRVPVGTDLAAGRLSALDALGNAGGEEKHVITPAETGIRNHKHAVSGTSGNESHTLTHNHDGGGTTGDMNANNPHHHNINYGQPVLFNTGSGTLSAFASPTVFNTPTSYDTNISHGHNYSFTTTNDAPTAHTHSISLNSLDPTGGELNGAAHGNMQPFQIFNWMIKL